MRRFSSLRAIRPDSRKIRTTGSTGFCAESRFTRKLSPDLLSSDACSGARFFFLFVILAAFHAGMAGSLLGQDDSGVEIIPAWSGQLNTPGYGYDGFGRSIVEQGFGPQRRIMVRLWRVRQLFYQ